MTDVKETKQALVALVLLGKAVAAAAKDGLDLSDAVALGSKLVSDEKFREALVEGVKGIDQVPAELKDIAASEALELLGAVYEALKA
jgi:hypothetical protein